MLKKLSHILAFPGLLILSGCGQLSDTDILCEAENEVSVLSMRYRDMIRAYSSDKDLVEESRLLGSRSGLGFWEGLGQSLIGNEHLVVSEGAPLHKAEYIIKNDIRKLERHAHALESRLLSSRPVYDKVINLRRVLLEILPVLAKQKTYVNESQFIEQQRVAKDQRRLAESQLYESRRQTKLLEQAARNQYSQPRQQSGYSVRKTTTVEIWD